jgi:histidine triad (HIT) family protein
MENCIFCRIAKSEIPSLKLYEDKFLFAFLDINPVTEGHILIIPKEHYENIFDAPEEILEKITKLSKKLAKTLKEKLNAKGVNILNASGKDAQQSVFHLHFHIVPRYENDGKNLGFHGEKKETKELQETQKNFLEIKI